MGAGGTEWSVDELSDTQHINKCRQVSSTQWYDIAVVM